MSVKISLKTDHRGQYVARKHQNPYQCVKNCGHCRQLDTVDKSKARNSRIHISVSKTVDIVDKWTQRINQEKGKIRSILVCQNQ